MAHQPSPNSPNSCLEKQEALKKIFDTCASSEKKYEQIIEMGRKLPPYPEAFKRPEWLVPGCQSLLYLYAELHEDNIRFYAYSEALISAGLAALLLSVYNDESPEALLTCPPRFLEELGITSSLSPSRSNGLASLFAKMQHHALKFLKTQA